MPEKDIHIEQGKDKYIEPRKGDEPNKGFVKMYQDQLELDAARVLLSPKPGKSEDVQALGREFLSACERGNPETLKIFFDAGMDVNFQDPRTGQTALHISGAARAHKAVRALLATKKCDFLIRDNKGRLSSEIAYLYGNDPELAELLGNKEKEQAESQGIKLTRRPSPKP